MGHCVANGNMVPSTFNGNAVEKDVVAVVWRENSKNGKCICFGEDIYPANLEMKEYSCLASEVDCYNVAPVIIGEQSTISQGAYLCTASHDITDPLNHLITAPIVIEDQAWIGAKAFVGMGVTIGQGAVVGATASVYKNVESWTVVGGNPAKVIKKRVIN